MEIKPVAGLPRRILRREKGKRKGPSLKRKGGGKYRVTGESRPA